MANLNVTEVEGFAELNKKLKQLPDKVKRKEVLGIQRKLAAPIRKRYGDLLPQDTGNLSRSVAIRTVSARKSNGNPSIVIRPSKRGKNDGYYKFMVIRKGVRTGSIKRGSRKGLNTVVTKARNTTLTSLGQRTAEDVAKRTAKLVQKKIDRLSV